MKNLYRCAAMALVIAAQVGSVAAQPSGSLAEAATIYPSRPVRILVGFTPGGAPDITARMIAQKLSERWKQQVIVENRPGAGGTIAAQAVAASAPDGYTILSATNSLTVAAAIQAKLSYDTQKDLAAVALTSTAPALLVVPPALGVKSTSELIALAKDKPGQLNYSSAGVGSGTHFGTELFVTRAGINVVHIPFKGVPESLTEAVTGRVQFVLSPLGAALNLVRQGKLAAIGVSGATRSAQLPDVPTMAESGLPGFRFYNWSGFVAPAQTPRAVVTKLNQEVARILVEPDVKARWAALGADGFPMAPEEFEKMMAEEIAAFTRIAKASNIKAD